MSQRSSKSKNSCLDVYDLLGLSRSEYAKRRKDGGGTGHRASPRTRAVLRAEGVLARELCRLDTAFARRKGVKDPLKLQVLLQETEARRQALAQTVKQAYERYCALNQKPRAVNHSRDAIVPRGNPQSPNGASQTPSKPPQASHILPVIRQLQAQEQIAKEEIAETRRRERKHQLCQARQAVVEAQSAQQVAQQREEKAKRDAHRRLVAWRNKLAAARQAEQAHTSQATKEARAEATIAAAAARRREAAQASLAKSQAASARAAQRRRKLARKARRARRALKRSKSMSSLNQTKKQSGKASAQHSGWAAPAQQRRERVHASSVAQEIKAAQTAQKQALELHYAEKRRSEGLKALAEQVRTQREARAAHASRHREEMSAAYQQAQSGAAITQAVRDLVSMQHTADLQAQRRRRQVAAEVRQKLQKKAAKRAKRRARAKLRAAQRALKAKEDRIERLAEQRRRSAEKRRRQGHEAQVHQAQVLAAVQVAGRAGPKAALAQIKKLRRQLDKSTSTSPGSQAMCSSESAPEGQPQVPQHTKSSAMSQLLEVKAHLQHLGTKARLGQRDLFPSISCGTPSFVSDGTSALLADGSAAAWAADLPSWLLASSPRESPKLPVIPQSKPDDRLSLPALPTAQGSHLHPFAQQGTWLHTPRLAAAAEHRCTVQPGTLPREEVETKSSCDTKVVQYSPSVAAQSSPSSSDSDSSLSDVSSPAATDHSPVIEGLPPTPRTPPSRLEVMPNRHAEEQAAMHAQEVMQAIMNTRSTLCSDESDWSSSQASTAETSNQLRSMEDASGWSESKLKYARVYTPMQYAVEPPA